MNPTRAPLLVFLLLAPVALQAQEVSVGATGGWPDEITFNGRNVGAKTAGQGIVLDLFTPAKDDDGLPEHSVLGVLAAVRVEVDGIEGKREGGEYTENVSGKVSIGKETGTFKLRIVIPARRVDVDFGRMDVTYTFTWTGKPDALIAAHGIRIPFAFGKDPRRTKVVVENRGRSPQRGANRQGGKAFAEGSVPCFRRGETWWVDPNDMWHIYWMLSDQKERWPLWRLGGITQESPERFVIWKANRADTVPLVVDQGQEIGDATLLPYGPQGAAHNRVASPISRPVLPLLEGRGQSPWLDVSDTDHGVTVLWDEMPKRAPCALAVNWPARMIEVWFHPPSSAPRTAESLGYARAERPVTWNFSLAYHDDVFPVTQKQEISRAVYAELLRLVDEQKLWQYVAMNYLVPVAGDLDTRIRQAIDTGIQPSELLGYFDSASPFVAVSQSEGTGNPWKMQKLCGAVGARWSNDHAANVKAVLDYCAQRAPKR